MLIISFFIVVHAAMGGGPCFGMGGFLEGHGDILRGNRCLIGLGQHSTVDDGCRDPYCASKVLGETRSTDDEPTVIGGLWGGCQNSHVTLTSNEYYTPDGTAMIGCGEEVYTLEDAATHFGLEGNSSSAVLPNEETIVGWAESMLMRPSDEWSSHPMENAS
jgi:hypothetical protein